METEPLKSCRFYKLFTLSCCAFVVLFILYGAWIVTLKHYREQQLIRFYAQEHAIAATEALVNIKFSPIKKIPVDQPVRILVLEGGGLDGIITSTLLAYLEKESGRPISASFDIISGSSVGALQSVLLTTPTQQHHPKYSALDVLNILRNESPIALQATYFNWLSSGFSLVAPLIDTTAYINLLKHYLGLTQLSQLTANVLLTGYNLPERRILFFTSRSTHIEQSNFLLYQLLSGITAIPGIMPPQQITSLSPPTNTCYLLADPSSIINNPIIAALQYADLLYPKNKKILVFLGMGLDDVHQKKSIDDYFNGLFGAAMEYYNMSAWSHDKLLKLAMTEMLKSHAFGLSELFFIDENLNVSLGNTTSASKENIALLEEVGNTIVQHHKAELRQLSQQLTR